MFDEQGNTMPQRSRAVRVPRSTRHLDNSPEARIQVAKMALGRAAKRMGCASITQFHASLGKDQAQLLHAHGALPKSIAEMPHGTEERRRQTLAAVNIMFFAYEDFQQLEVVQAQGGLKGWFFGLILERRIASQCNQVIHLLDPKTRLD